jgi:hypothetical protein
MVEKDLRTLLAAQAQEMRSGFAAIESGSRQRHTDVIRRFERVDDEQQALGERIAVLENIVKTGVDDDRRREVAADDADRDRDVDDDQVTVGRLRFYLWIAAGSIGGTLGLLKLINKLGGP